MDKDSSPAVLVHGLIGTLRDPALLEGIGPRPAFAPDLLGYGDLADVPPERIGLDAQVGHLLTQVEDAAGGGKVHLVGHSVGGARKAASLEGVHHLVRIRPRPADPRSRVRF